MSYLLHITETAERDLAEAADYIEFSLKNPAAADRLFDLLAEETAVLAEQPKLFPLIGDAVLAAWGIRFVRVNRYLAFYTIDEPAKTVHIVRFLYGRRNWAHILKTEEF